MGDLSCLCRKIGQGHPRVMIYIYCRPPLLYAKFQNHWPPGSDEEDFLKIFVIYSHGGHLGHVTMTLYANFHSLFLRMLHIKFGFDWPNGFREEDV